MIKNNAVVLFAWIALQSAALLFPGTGSAGLPVPPPPPPLFIPAPPPVVLIPGTYVYFPPDIGDDLLFYHGYWYRPAGGRWYRATHYNGPWGFVAPGKIPQVLIGLPPGYRSVPPGHQRIPHGQLKKNWKTWEHDKHWDKPAKKMKQEVRKKKKHENKDHGSGHGGGKGRGR